MEKQILYPKASNDGSPYIFSLERIKYKNPFYHQNSLEILFVIKGTVEIEIEDEQHTLNEGDFILINAGFVHTIKNKDYALVTSFYINLNHFEKKIPSIRGYSFYCHYLEGDESEANVYHMIRNFLIRLMIVEELKIPQIREIGNEICEIIMDILINHVVDGKYLKRKISAMKAADINRIFSISKYIITHYKDEGFSLAQVAANENLSLTRLSHFWKEMVGISLMDSVNLNRYHESKRMLMSTDLSISEIANICGYSDEKYLYKVFKDRHSMTPNEFRKNHKKIHEKPEFYESINVQEIHDLIDEYQKKYYTKEIDFSFLNISENRMEEEKKIHHLYSKITSIDSKTDNEMFDTAAILNLDLNSGIREKGKKNRINWEYVYVVAYLSIIFFIDCSISIKVNLMTTDEWIEIFTKIQNRVIKNLGKGLNENVFILIMYSNEDEYRKAIDLSAQLKDKEFFSKILPVYSL